MDYLAITYYDIWYDTRYEEYTSSSPDWSDKEN